MPVQFIPIRGGKYCFIDNQDIRNSIDEAGRKIVVFVEGYECVKTNLSESGE